MRHKGRRSLPNWNGINQVHCFLIDFKLNPKIKCDFHDIDQLTAFADYRVPQTLLEANALEYSAELIEQLKGFISETMVLLSLYLRSIYVPKKYTGLIEELER